VRKRWIILGAIVSGLLLHTGCGGRAATLSPTGTQAAAPTAAATTTGVPASPSSGATSSPTQPAATQPAALEPSPEALPCNGSLTLAQTEGPYYTPNSPERSSLVEEGIGGTPLLVTGRVFDQDCQPIAGAKVDFWQTDDQGQYDNSGYRLRGHQYTDENGAYGLETIVPGEYPGRTAHVHVKVFAPDGKELLTTQIYIPGLSDQTPDGIYSPELLAQDLEPEAAGRRRLGFNFVVVN
jgi:protocatechuate 3,4-dioxygenase beta subunit